MILSIEVFVAWSIFFALQKEIFYYPAYPHFAVYLRMDHNSVLTLFFQLPYCRDILLNRLYTGQKYSGESKGNSYSAGYYLRYLRIHPAPGSQTFFAKGHGY